jgi:hypothetical protein
MSVLELSQELDRLLEKERELVVQVERVERYGEVFHWGRSS